ncbi:site-specific recombinase XerD [Streptomyces sp. CG 926]|uniref:tyrosine-type recombinase/integrase n=1 Tax=Streptomyces sp. CG 926 TaxID=1882405 RepID=UPI000D7AB6B1|nr:site-specific integrase [Streptomyces sp. CG 926]PWK74759.1 site-specific recombinase XerD [Streptomyces sp. CG 926]
MALRDVSATVLRGYVATLEGECSPRYARQILTSLSNIFETAIDDKRLVRNPMRAKTVRWPKAPDEDRDAWPLATAQRVRDVINPRYRIAVVVALGCGLRQGELFGLSPRDIDFERGVIRVRRQVQLLPGRLYFALSKGGKTRIVDMPRSVAVELAAYFLDHPAVDVELPWGGPEPDRLRHTYASVLLEAGESIVTLARWLGHSSPTITLDHYAHFMPEAGGKGRAAIDALLGTVPEYVPEGLVPAQGGT